RRVVSNDFEGGLTVISTRKNLTVWSHAISSQEVEDSTGQFVPRRSAWASPEEPTGASNNYFGAWERIVSQENESEDDEAASQEVDYPALKDAAQRDAQGRWPVPLEINANDLNLIPSTDLPISDLVPGTLMPVSANWNLRPVNQMMILTGLTVE